MGTPFRADAAKERPFLHLHQKNYQVRSNSYMIWFVGAAVWWIDAALNLHAGSLMHALLAIGISLLFLLAGAFFRRQALRK